MIELTDDEKRVLKRLKKASDERKKIAWAKKKTITHQDKYSFPIGLDDKGDPFRK